MGCREFFLSAINFLYDNLSEIVYNKTINCFQNVLKLFIDFKDILTDPLVNETYDDEESLRLYSV